MNGKDEDTSGPDRATLLHSRNPGRLFLLLFVWEHRVPLRTARAAPARRLFVLNVGISALALGTAALIVDPVGATTLQLVSDRQFGLLHWVELPAAAQFVMGFVLMEMAFYTGTSPTTGFLFSGAFTTSIISIPIWM